MPAARWTMIILCCLANTINYIDRANLAVAAPIMSRELGIDAAEMGLVLSGFFWTYSVMQMPFGWFADRVGARISLAVAVVWWSIFTALTAAARGIASLMGCRLLLGVGEAGAYPSMAKVAANWFPSSERGIASSIFDSGSRIGAALSLPLVTWLIATFSWETSFVVTGLLGIVWAIFWVIIYRDPERHPSVTQEQLARLQAERRTKETGPKVPWGSLFTASLSTLAADSAVDAVALAVDLVPEFDGDESYRDAVLAAAAGTELPVCVLSHVPSALDLVGDKYLTGAEWNWEKVYVDFVNKLKKGEKVPNYVRGGLKEGIVKPSPYGKDFCPRKGRIPGARWIEWYRMMKPTPTGPMFKSREEILAECATVGITPQTPVVLYCFKGARASNTLVALKEAGVDDVRMYFGSWNEWSRDPALPIETGLPYTEPAAPSVAA